MTVVVIATTVTIELISIEESLVTVAAQRMALKREVVLVADAFVSGQLFPVVVFSFVGKESQELETQLTIVAFMIATQMSVKLVELLELHLTNRALVVY